MTGEEKIVDINAFKMINRGCHKNVSFFCTTAKKFNSPCCAADPFVVLPVVVENRCDASCVVFGFVCQISGLTAFGGLDNVHTGTAGSIRNHDEASCHQLNDADAKMLVPHRVNSYEGLLVTLNKLLVGSVDYKFDMLVQREVLSEIF